MQLNSTLQEYPSVDALVAAKAASRVHAKDATLYDFSAEAQESSANFMGWTALASVPQCPLDEVQAFADETVAAGLDQVILIAQGGSIQAPMTMADYHAPEGNRVAFYPLDSDSPANLRYVLDQVDPARTLVIVASKSGGTIEPNTMKAAVWAEFSQVLSAGELPKHFVAITDPGSSLQQMAEDEGWRAIFFGEPTVGGRFSALSVFGLLPAALIGLDLQELIASVRETELACAADTPENPAIQLAAFMYDNQQRGRGKFSLVTPARAATLCLWIEQLVAESTGKDGKGELPNTEPDVNLLAIDDGQRCVVTYVDAQDETPEGAAYAESLGTIAAGFPRIDAIVTGTVDLVSHFVIWEYATALCGYLMKVCPFDQPDVASAKAVVLDILASDLPAFPLAQTVGGLELQAKVSAAVGGFDDIAAALKALFASYGEGDYVSINAFLPPFGGRFEALDAIRHDVAAALGSVTCLEIGPRYLHSIGQLQKGGPNNGVFLLVSCEDEPDIPVEGMKAPSLATLAKAQTAGDYVILSERGRRVIELRLPGHDLDTIAALRSVIQEALA